MAGLNEAPAALNAARARIDDIDARLIALIAERFGVVDGVVRIKREAGIPALLQDRVDEVLAHVEALGQARGIPGGVATAVWRVLIAETIAYEDRQL
ncbi:chorismate mutase [Xanthobacter sp. V4C-4]|uniref:chorismate mutase n=1 Tax=Xanthobacter cornucopiae TaxID=3119924 RepID=UPI00372ABCF0